MRKKKRTTPNVKQEIVCVRKHFNASSNTEWVTYRMGECTIIVSHNGGSCWQLSIGHPRRLPTWDEVKRARYELLSHEIDMAMLLPRPEEYINVHEFCLQMIEVSADQDGACGEKLEGKVKSGTAVNRAWTLGYDEMRKQAQGRLDTLRTERDALRARLAEAERVMREALKHIQMPLGGDGPARTVIKAFLAASTTAPAAAQPAEPQPPTDKET